MSDDGDEYDWTVTCETYGETFEVDGPEPSNCPGCGRGLS